MYAQRGGDVAEFHFCEKKFHQRGMVDVVNIEAERIHALCSRWFLKGDQAEAASSDGQIIGACFIGAAMAGARIAI
jgi:hypothetical protein